MRLVHFLPGQDYDDRTDALLQRLHEKDGKYVGPNEKQVLILLFLFRSSLSDSILNICIPTFSGFSKGLVVLP